MTARVRLADYSSYLRSRGYKRMPVVRTEKRPGELVLVPTGSVVVGGRGK